MVAASSINKGIKEKEEEILNETKQDQQLVARKVRDG